MKPLLERIEEVWETVAASSALKVKYIIFI
jgi:hypothetical protein